MVAVVDGEGSRGCAGEPLVVETEGERVGLFRRAGAPAVCFVPASGYDRERVLRWARAVLAAASTLPVRAVMALLLTLVLGQDLDLSV